jgi:two-component system CheB/CheR fusion protein
MCDALRRNALAQSHLIRDLLDLSRLRSGKLTFNLETVLVRTAVSQALETVRADAEAKQLRIAIETPEELLFVEADPLRLEQVVWNLLSNAVKFTPARGSISISVHKEDDKVALTVADTGEGIDPAFLPHVFEMFRQADSRASRPHGGMGIGLALVRQMVELMGGTVSVTSEGLGKGTQFIVRFPEKSETKVTFSNKPAIPEGTLEALTALVVDDDEDTTALIRYQLEARGANVVMANSGADGLRIAAEQNFDVVLSDISMPGMDGFEFVRKLRLLPGKTDVPVLALTGFGRAEDINRAQDAGFFAHLTKPYDVNVLTGILQGLTDRKAHVE